MNFWKHNEYEDDSVQLWEQQLYYSMASDPLNVWGLLLSEENQMSTPVPAQAFKIVFQEEKVAVGPVPPITPKSTPQAPVSPTLDKFVSKNKAPTTANTTTTYSEAENEMSESKIDKLKRYTQSTREAVAKGAAQGAIGAANRRAVRLLEEAIGPNYPAVLKTPAGRRTLEGSLPVIINLVCEFDENNRIPGKDKIQYAANLAIQNVSSEVMSDALTTLMDLMGPILQSYAEAATGHMLADHQEVEEAEQDDWLERVSQMEDARVVAR